MGQSRERAFPAREQQGRSPEAGAGVNSEGVRPLQWVSNVENEGSLWVDEKRVRQGKRKHWPSLSLCSLPLHSAPFLHVCRVSKGQGVTLPALPQVVAVCTEQVS